MTNDSLTELIRQLRRTHFEFPLLKERQSRTVYMKHFAVAENEMDSMAAFMERQLSFTGLIENMLFRLEHETIPHNKKLSDYIQNLLKIFSGYASEGPYRTPYFTTILSSLQAFLGLIQLQNQDNAGLIIKFQSLVRDPDKNNLPDFYTEHAAACETDRERATENLREYYEVFNDFLQHEAEKKQGLNVITRSEEYLMNLTSMVSHAIYLSGSEQNLLNKWKSRLLLMEKQSQNN